VYVIGFLSTGGYVSNSDFRFDCNGQALATSPAIPIHEDLSPHRYFNVAALPGVAVSRREVLG
jgi:hypothetical protein